MRADFGASRRGADASTFLHRLELVVVAATSTVVKRQTLTERLVESISELPVAAAARKRRLRADVLGLDGAACAFALAHRLEAIGVAVTSGVSEALAFPFHAVEVEPREAGTAIAFGTRQTANFLILIIHVQLAWLYRAEGKKTVAHVISFSLMQPTGALNEENSFRQAFCG